jgi:hypothetical protein
MPPIGSWSVATRKRLSYGWRGLLPGRRAPTSIHHGCWILHGSVCVSGFLTFSGEGGTVRVAIRWVCLSCKFRTHWAARVPAHHKCNRLSVMDVLLSLQLKVYATK